MIRSDPEPPTSPIDDQTTPEVLSGPVHPDFFWGECFVESLFEAAADGFSVLDRDLNIIRVNQGFEAMFASEMPLVGKKCYQAYHGRELPCDGCPSLRAMETGEPSRETRPCVMRDGRRGWIELSSYPFRDLQGRVIGVIENVRDITEQKRAEEALLESERRYRAMIESMGDCVHLADTELRILLVNTALKQFCRRAGCQEGVVGRGIFEVFPFLSEEVREEYERVIRTREPLVTEEYNEIGGEGYFTETRKIPVIEGGRVTRVLTIIRDTSARERALAALRENEEQLRTFFDDLSDAAYRSDAEGNITYVNGYSEQLTGLPMKEVIGKPFLPLFTPESQRIAVDAYQRTLRGESPEFELTFTTGRICQFRNKPLRNDRGEIVGTFGVARDVTEHKQAQEALKRSELHFRSLIENASELIVVLGEDETIQYQSPSVERVLGHEPDDLMGRNVFELVHPDDVDRVRAGFEWGNQTPGRVTPVEFRVRHRDGTYRDLEATGTNLLYDPAVGGAVINARDITERKKADTSRLVFSQSVEQSSEAIFMFDANAKMTFANKAAEALYGYEMEEMLGRRPRDLFGINDAVVEEVWTALRRDFRWSGVHEVRDKEGNRFPVEANIILIPDEQGNPVAAASFSRDARESRRLEYIRQVAEAAAGTETPDEEAIHNIMSHLPELVGLDRWGIYLYNPEKDALELRFCSDAGRALAEAVPVIPASSPLSGQVFRSGEIVFSPDVSSDHRFTRNPTFRSTLSTTTGRSMRATCILPIRSAGRILGTMYLSDQRVRTLTPDELATVKTLASQIGLLLSRTAAAVPEPSRLGPAQPPGIVSVVAESEAMQFVINSAKRVAKTTMPVVILGATGAGKGHLAKYIHSISRRANGPFLAVNCACLDGELILSELFGHERGAFTGAVRQQKGCFELANGGTLLLDEVVELPLSAQAKLLQLVETQRFRRLGGEETIITDVRLICTTNADIRECVRKGKMRQDLYYRLNAAAIVIPPLCERLEDIRPLAEAFLRTQALTTGEPVRTLTDGAIARCREYHWPGNVRELQNVLALAISHGSQVIGARDLHFAPTLPETVEATPRSDGKTQREVLLESLRRNRWNRTLASEELGIHRNTLRNRMRKYGIYE